MKSLVPLLATGALALVLAVSVKAQSQGRPITVLKTDNNIVNGEMVSLNDKRIVVRQTDGKETTIAIDEIHELVFNNPEQQPSSRDGSVTPPPRQTKVDPENFARCLTAFRRILSAVELGVSYLDYRQELLEAKLQFDQAIGSVPESEQRTDLLEAMTDLRIAADAWQIGIQYDGIPTKDDFYRSLNSRYSFGVSPRLGLKVNYSAVLKLIWAKASNRLEHALSLQR